MEGCRIGESCDSCLLAVNGCAAEMSSLDRSGTKVASNSNADKEWELLPRDTGNGRRCLPILLFDTREPPTERRGAGPISTWYTTNMQTFPLFPCLRKFHTIMKNGSPSTYWSARSFEFVPPLRPLEVTAEDEHPVSLNEGTCICSL